MTVSITNDRQKQVLKAIVEGFVKSSQPIGSNYIVEMLPFNVSSATIRNDMTELTQAGFIAQPHTSAGRVPTDKGYKAYIEMTMREHKELSHRQQEILSAHFRRLKGLQERFREAARLLSELSGNVGLLIDDTNQVYMSGLSNLSKLPEFRDAEFGEDFMELLENPLTRFRKIAQELNHYPKVVFGDKSFGRASIIITRFGPGGKKIVSVIGPMRMPYGKTLPAVDYIAKILNEEI